MNQQTNIEIQNHLRERKLFKNFDDQDEERKHRNDLVLTWVNEKKDVDVFNVPSEDYRSSSKMNQLFRSFKHILNKPVYTKNTRIDGKVAIITGGNSGIGRETAIDLARRGGKVYIACRDLQRSEDALREIREISESSEAYLLELDLASIESIREFSKTFHNLEDSLHILINNAGVMACPKSYTKDGFEMQFGTNHLGHFLMTNLLLDLLKASSPSRIVVVSSSGHRLSDINRDDLMSENGYNKIKAYASSKLANILFTHELARRLRGTGVTVNSCHPGIVQTDLGRHMDSWLRPIYRQVLQPYYKTIHEGAQTQIKLAVDPELENVTGKYFVDCEEAKPSKSALDAKLAEWLWMASTKLIKSKLKDFKA